MFLGSCVLFGISEIESLKSFKNNEIIFSIFIAVFVIVNFLLFAAKKLYNLKSKEVFEDSVEF